MIVGIGCDIVDHKETIDLGWLSNSRLQQRVFSLEELQLYQTNRTIRFISGRFATKEAVLKSLSIGIRDGISLTDIQVLQNSAGKPILEIGGEVKRIAEQLGISSWHITISHSAHTSAAFVVAEGER
jgi:holo-[acyl-carrier protein] synthase